jgi:hypothetical protein
MVTGFWANDGLNDDKGSRDQALVELEQHFEKAVKLILSGQSIETTETLTEEDEQNPFLAPAIKATREIETPRDDEGTVKDALKSEGFDPEALDQT